MDEIFELTSRHMLVGRLIFIRIQTAFRNIVGFCREIVNYMSNMFETAQNPRHLEKYIWNNMPEMEPLIILPRSLLSF